MKKIYVVLSMIAVVASTLFVSCAQKKEPDVVVAPPANKTTTYGINLEGEREWTWASSDAWTKANYWRGFWRHATDAENIVRYTITPNVAWTAEIPAEYAEYIQFNVVKPGHDADLNPDNYELSSTASGNRGSNTLQVVVLKVPGVDEEMVTCVANIIMGGESTPFLTVNIAPDEW